MSEGGGGEGPVVDVGVGGGEPQLSDGESVAEASSEGLADALKAAEEALGPIGDDADEDVQAPGPEKTVTEQQAKDDDADLEGIERTLAKRREEAREKMRLREEIAKEKAEIEQHRHELSRKEQEVLEAAQYIRKLRNDPAAAVRALGIEPEDFIAQLANGATPEYKQKSELDSIRAELAETKRALQERSEREKQEQEQYRVRQAQQLAHRAESDFYRTAVSDDFPTLKSLFSGEDAGYLIAKANDVAERYYQAAGKPAAYRDIAEYLEHQYSSALGQRIQPQQGKPPQGKRGAVTLGSIQAERSTGSVPSKDDSDEEALKKALAATKAELKSFSG